MDSSCPSNDVKQKDSLFIPEIVISNNPLQKLDLSITKACKSLCKIIISPKKIGSGFLIQLFKGKDQFFCLMTNEHVVTKKMIEERQKIDAYYDSQSKLIEINLNPQERFIKDFRDIEIDATIIEILPKDDIPKDYFLLPLIDYMDNYDKLIGEDIAIIQFPKGEMNYSYGKIIEIRQTLLYEFAYNASTDKGSSGSPIFLKGTTKVVGIHKGNEIKNEDKTIKKNIGNFIFPIFSYFKNYLGNRSEINDNHFINDETNKVIQTKNVLNNNKEVTLGNKINNNEKNNLVENNSNIKELNQLTIIYEIKNTKIQ